LLVCQKIQPRSQDTQGGAQFVRRIRSEIALNPQPLFKPVQRLVDRGYQRAHLARNLFGRQTKAGTRWSDFAGDLRGLPKRPQSTTEDGNIRDQQCQKDRQRYPSDILVEISDDIIDQHVAVGEVLTGLDPDGLAADDLPDAGAGHRGVATPLLQKLFIAGSGVGGEQGRTIPQGGKQNPTPIIDHSVGITPVFLRIETEQIERQVQFETAVRLRAQMLAD
jgi:hypothetical protein